MANLIASASRVPGLELELFTDTQFADAYLNGRPFASIRRRHAFDPAGDPPWRLWWHGCDRAIRCYSAAGVVRQVEALARIEAQAVAS